jgi:hypothetical protein
VKALAALAAAAASLLLAGSGTAGSGGLVQLRGPSGCVTPTGANGCTRGYGVADLATVVVTRDGRNVYAAGGVGSLSSIAIFARAPSGALRQLPGRTGCIHEAIGSRRCAPGVALETPVSIAVSPDGRHVYVAAENSSALGVYARGRAGALRFLACVSPTNPRRCATARALVRPAAVTVSPDGHQVYVGSPVGLAVFRRNAVTGMLTQPAGADGCVNGTGAAGCTKAPGLLGADALAATADGRALVAAGGGGAHGAVTAFRRDPATGALTPAGCLTQLADVPCPRAPALAQPAAVASAGLGVYVASTVSGGVTGLTRDAQGSLAFSRGCVSVGGSAGRCVVGRALGAARGLAVRASASILRLYVATGTGVAVLDTDAGGRLVRQAGCVGGKGCVAARGVSEGRAVALSPGRRHLYVAGRIGVAAFRAG